MKRFSKLLLFILILLTITIIGCKTEVIPDETPTVCPTPLAISISIEGAPIISTRYPLIHVKAENATCMAFSGDKINWFWTKYQETFNGLDISTLPTVKSNELKVLYFKVKNKCGMESNIISTSFIYNKPEPFLIVSAVYVDSNKDNIVDTDDVVIVSFNKKIDMDSVDVNANNVFDIYNVEAGDLIWNGIVDSVGTNYRQLKIVLKSTIDNFTPGFTKLEAKSNSLRDEDGYYIEPEEVIIY